MTIKGRRGGTKILAGSLLILALAMFSPASAEEPDKKEDPPGPRRVGLEVSDQSLKVDVNLAIHIDYLGFDEGAEMIEGAGSQENDFIVRRARLSFRGQFDHGAAFYLQAGFEVPDHPFLDAVIMIPVGREMVFWAGQMKAPFSQERIRSYATGQPFMERSLAANLELRRTQGIMLIYNPGGGPLETSLAITTGETMNRNNTDDHFEFGGRVTLKPHLIFDELPGKTLLGASYARGRREPVRRDINSFSGRTMNNLVFFSGVPVNGYRTRYELDWEWRWESISLAAEYIYSHEERRRVTVDLDTDGDGIEDATFTGNLDPLVARGWMVYFVWALTGEPYAELIEPARPYGAWVLAVRYSELGFKSGESKIPAGGGIYGVEVSESSQALGRPDLEETARELYLGLNVHLHRGVFIQAAVLWYWFDESSPSLDRNTNDINYRARVGLVF